MSLPIPGLQSCWLLFHTFTLGSQATCHHLPIFHLNLGVRIIPFYTKELQTLNRAWIPSSLIPLRHQNWTPPLMSLMSLRHLSHQDFYIYLVLFLILPNHSLLLVLDLHKLWSQPRALLSPVYLATKVSASKLFHHFCHPWTFWFWSSAPPDNITVTSSNRKACQSLFNFQTGICAVAHATLNMEQLISYIRILLVDTAPSLQDSEGGVITFQRCMNYFSRFMTFWKMPCPKGLIIQLVI